MLLLKFFWIFILFLLILNHAEGVRKRRGKGKNVEQVQSNPEAEKGESGDEKQTGKIEKVDEEKDKGTPPKTYASVLSEAPKAPKITETGQSSKMIPPKIGQKPSQNPPSPLSNPKGVHQQVQSQKGGMSPHFQQPKLEKVGMHPKNSQDKIQNTQQSTVKTPSNTETKTGESGDEKQKEEGVKAVSSSQPPPKRGNIIAVADPTLKKVEGEETDAQRTPLEGQNTLQKSSTDSQLDGFTTIKIGNVEVKIPKEKIKQKNNSESSISESDKIVDLNKEGKQIEKKESQAKEGVTFKTEARDIKSEIPMDVKQGYNPESNTSESDEKEKLNKEKQIEEEDDPSSNSETSEATSSSGNPQSSSNSPHLVIFGII